MSGLPAKCDVITLELVAGAIRALVDEVSSLVERTAMSPFVREKKDFHVAMYDRNGRMLHGNGIMIALRGVDPVLKVFPVETMQDGDVYWYNDCYQSEGEISHTPDQAFIKPVYLAGELIGFIETLAHFNDIGGLRPGTLSPDCTSIFHEGTIIPPVRIERGGWINEDLIRVFSRNSRFPEMVRGDIRSLAAGVRLGARRMEELFARFGTAVVEDGLDQLQTRTAAEVRRRIRALMPEGEYEFTEVLDSDGQGNGPFDITLRVTVTPDRILLDARQSSDQCAGAFNFLMPETAPSALLAMLLLDGDFTLNDGIGAIFDEVLLREGSILRPRFPAALGIRGMTLMRVQSALIGIMAKATRGQFNASGASFVICYLRGQTEEGTTFLLSDPLGTGYGAHPAFDGNDGVYLPANINYPAEFVDSSYPIRVRRYELVEDSGGPGRWRGGCGILRELEILAPEVIMAIRLDCVDFPPWGVSGGMSGGRGSCIINPGRADERATEAIVDGVVLRKGDVVRIVTGGGGGWGHPYDREPERVLTDVLGGIVSAESARRDYGVAISADGRSIDAEQTEALRARRPDTKLFHRDEYLEAL